MRYGSLCSGIGGLDRAVETVWIDATPAWFCESDPHAARVLARHWPDVPILPDLKTQDWSAVEPVELICAGYPCQPFSHAGKRQGAADPRHLWPAVLDAVRLLRPRLVVLENVAGHLGLGFDRVLGDLAETGFDAEWSVVPASAAGACHRRERLFVVAADTDGQRCEELREPHGEPEQPRLEASRRDDVDRRDAAPADATRGGESRGRRHGPEDDGDAAANADRERKRRPAQEQAGSVIGRGVAHDDLAVAWGVYAAAIERWEHVLGRPAPNPTDDRGRLSVTFVEWMQGFDAGWVDGLTRTAALRCLGNARRCHSYLLVWERTSA